MKADGSRKDGSDQSQELKRTGTAAIRAALESSSVKRSRAPLIIGLALGLVVMGVLGAGLYQVMAPKGVGGANRPTPTTSPSPATSTPTTAAPNGTQGGAGLPDLTVGLVGPFTGPNKELGRGMKAGLELAFAAANEAGGVDGRKIALVALDDGYDPARTPQVLKELVEERQVFAVVGSVGGATAAVSAPYLVGKRVVLLGALSGSPALRRDPPDRYVFNFRPSTSEEAAAATRYLLQTRKFKPEEIIVFAQQDQFGDAGYNEVAKQMRDLARFQGTVQRVGYKRNTADVTQAVSRVRELQPKAVIMIATYHAAATFIVKVREAGVKPVFMNVSEVDGVALADELLQYGGGAAAENVIVIQVVPPPTSSATVVMRYRKALEKLTVGERPGFVSLEGYVVGSILVEALKRLGNQFDKEKLVDALESLRGLDLGIGVPVSFSPREHQASHRIWGTELTSTGAFQQLELE